MPSKSEESDALRSIELWKRRDPVAFVKANKFQERLFRACRDPKPESITVVLALKPNRVGGSFGVMNIWSAIMFGSENNPKFKGSPFGKDWPFIKAARLFSTSQNLEDAGALQISMGQVFPVGKYEQSRGTGKGYNSAGKSSVKDGDVGHGWTWDAFTFGQDALSAAGATKGLVICSEPPPRPLFTECITRVSGNGLIIVECVQLDLAPWLEEMADDAGGKEIDGVRYGSLRLDGKVVGEVRVVRGDVEDCCREHSNGHMAHSAIEAMVALWPEEEREARKTGKPLRLSGRVLPNWGEENELDALPEYHADCFKRGMVRIASTVDPHDRKPWFCTWIAAFPNEDLIAMCEWPPFDFQACKSSPVSDIERYRDIIIEAEAGLGGAVDVRIIDGLFGAAIKSGRGLNCIQMLSAPCLGCIERDGKEQAWLACPHKLRYKQGLAYNGSIRDGNMLMRSHIGEGGARPKLMALKEFTPNLCASMRKYAWKENSVDDRGDSEKPALVWKDGVDTVRMAMLAGFHKWPSEVAPARIIPRRKR